MPLQGGGPAIYYLNESLAKWSIDPAMLGMDRTAFMQTQFAPYKETSETEAEIPSL